MHRIWAGALVAALALTLAIAGCGGDDEPSTRGDFASEANAICKRVNRDTIRALRDAQKGQEIRESRGPVYAELVVKVAEIRQRGVDDLDALTPPDGQADAYDRFVETRRAGVELLPTESQAEAGEDPQGQKRAAQESTGSKLARRLGIRC
jgi:hypothetical protein